MNNEYYCQLVSSRGIAYQCNHHPKNLKSDTVELNIDDYKNIQNGDKVYVVSSALDKFFNLIFPTILRSGVQITLVTGACVTSVPQELSKVHGKDYMKLMDVFSKNIKCWFTQNCDVVDHDKIKPIPLGLDYHTLQGKSAHLWGLKQTALQQEDELLQIQKRSKEIYSTKKCKSYSYYHFVKFDRHDFDRHKADDVLKNKSFNVFQTSRFARSETWKRHLDYHFIISPHGKGLDCHRTWEAICLGCIPVVKTSSLDILYENLPVLILKKWDDLNEELLQKTLEEFKTRTFDFQRVDLKYWVDKIV
jgi:hypothetical protein